jgi:SAM-dependent methyltransferase
MRRVNTLEILDSATCPPEEAARSLQDLGRINRWFGGVATTQALIERVARACGANHFSLLEVAAGFGDVPRIAAEQLARQGIIVDITLLDRFRSHLRGRRALVADALALPFSDGSFDLVSCNLFAHHLEPEELARFLREALRVSRRAVLINDLVRHPLHLALVYPGFALMRSHVSRVDGVASVRRAYVPEEIRDMLSAAFPPARTPQVEIFRHFLFRMGVTVWKSSNCVDSEQGKPHRVQYLTDGKTEAVGSP